MATDEIRLPADGVFLGRAMAEGWAHPAIVTVRDGMVLDITSKAAPTSRDVCEQADPAGYVAKAEGKPVGTLADIADEQLCREARSEEALSAVAGRPAGGEGGGRHLRRLAARTRHRGAGARLGRKSRSDPRRHRLADRPRSLEAETGLGRSSGRQGEADRARGLVAISRSRHRPGRRDLHQVPAHGIGRFRRRCRAASDLDLEQSRAGNRGDRVERAAASSAPRSATTSICAMSRAVPRCCSARPRTTMPRPRWGRSSACSTGAFRWTT